MFEKLKSIFKRKYPKFKITKDMKESNGLYGYRINKDNLRANAREHYMIFGDFKNTIVRAEIDFGGRTGVALKLFRDNQHRKHSDFETVNDLVKHSDFTDSVVLGFENVESIDNIINELNVIKGNLTNLTNTKNEGNNEKS